MKKTIINTIILLLSITIIEVNALSIWDTNRKGLNYQTPNLNEEIIPLRDNYGNISQINITITIPEAFNEKIITINPDIFNGLENYKRLLPGEEVTINLKIINNSSNDYSYIQNSFYLSTENISNDALNNYKIVDGIGFDNQNLYDIFSPYRTFNDAIIKLYNYNNEEEYKQEDLTDEKLTIKLKQKGYSGVDELDKYYLDFYNNKYNLNEKSLDQFTTSTIKEIFSGINKSVKETNSKIIELSYNYYYNNLLLYEFPNQETIYLEDLSIGSYMRNNKENEIIKETFINISKNSSKELKDMSISLNPIYTPRNLSINYNLKAHFEFKLEQINQTTNLEEEYITPPNTGI